MLARGNQPHPDATHTTLVARHNATDEIVGFAVGRVPHVTSYSYLPPMDVATSEVIALYVDPLHQGRRIDSALLSGVMQPMGPSVRLTTTKLTDAVNFYIAHGFEPRPTWTNEVAVPALRFHMVFHQLAMSCSANPYRKS